MGGLSNGRSLTFRMSTRTAIVLTVVAEIMLAGVIWHLNRLPSRHPGFFDWNSPFADAWSPDPRTEYGWPATCWRQFDQPSEFNAPGRFSSFEFIFNVLTWTLLGTLVVIPLLVCARVYRYAWLYKQLVQSHRDRLAGPSSDAGW